MRHLLADRRRLGLRRHHAAGDGDAGRRRGGGPRRFGRFGRLGRLELRQQRLKPKRLAAVPVQDSRNRLEREWEQGGNRMETGWRLVSTTEPEIES